MAFRVIARLDVKPPHLVKGIHLEGLRRIGNPREFAVRYYAQGADEISYQDIVASLYGRNSIVDLVSSTCQQTFVPLTVGGGIRTADDAGRLLRNGADKICVNTAAIAEPSLIGAIANEYGSQAVVVGIEAKRHDAGWLAMTDCGREHTNKNVIQWAVEVERSGAGEILLTSIDHEGTMRGFDLDLINAVRQHVNIPLVAHGGLKDPLDAVRAFNVGADAVAVAAALHSESTTIGEIKECLRLSGVEIRP